MALVDLSRLTLPSIPTIKADFATVLLQHTRTAAKHLNKVAEEFQLQAAQRYAVALDSHRQRFHSPPRILNNQTFVEDTNSKAFNCRIGTHEFESFYTPAEDSKDFVVLITGCKSKAVHWQKQILDLNNQRKSVFTINTSIPGRDTGFVEDNYAMLKYNLFDKSSPLRQMAKEHGGKIKLISHSFGGYLLIRALQDPENKKLWERDKNIFGSIVNMNAFLSAKSLNPDRNTGALFRKFYLGEAGLIKGHAEKYPDRHDGELLGDLLHAHFNKLMGEPKVWASNGTPTHGQVAELQKAADKLRHAITKDGFPDAVKTMNIRTLIGIRDYMADPISNSGVSQTLNGKNVVLDAWHNPWHESPNVALPIIKDMLDMKPKQFEAKYPQAGYAALFASSPALRTLQAA